MLFLSLNGCSKEDNFVSSKMKFNSDWHFIKVADETISNEEFITDINFTSWEKVNLPHTSNIEPKIVNNQWQGISWYKKEFLLSKNQQEKKLFLHFEGAMNIAEVWVNGTKLIKHQGGYLPFVVDFTEVTKFNQTNNVVVKLNNKDNPITGPKPLEKLDFNTYGGIYRNVWLITKNKLYITDPILENKTASGGVFVTYPKVSDNKATINIKTHIRNENDKSASFLVRNTLLKNNSIILSEETENYSLKFNADKQIIANIEVENPNLWSPKTPNLYDLKTEIIQNGEVVDSETTRIGIKTMKFIGQDFYLNGEKTFLRGVNRHQEYPHIGYALSDNANYRDAKKIKEAGFDYVRLSHYPQSNSFMDACDELGLVTIDAILGWQYFSEDKNFQEHVFQASKELIRRDRNHASVLAWEVSLNESWMPEPFIDKLIKIAHQEYPGNQCFTAGWQAYGYDIYLQARQHRLQHYDASLKKPYNVSEYGDWEYYAMNAGLNQDDWSGLLQQERSSRQLRSAGEKALLQQAKNIQEAHNDNLKTPAFADGYWVMYDYNRGYADDLEASGIMDIFRLPKPAYYFYQSQRDAKHPQGKPMIYVANQWKKDSPLEVRVFSNCDEVELFLNDKSLGIQKPDNNRISNHLKHPPFTFSIPKYVKGKLEAKGFIDGNEVVNYLVKTPETPKEIILEIDESNSKITTNDVVFLYAKMVDKNGTILTDFDDKVTFNLEGSGMLIGENPVAFEAGIASIILKTGKDISNLKITAKTKDFKVAYTNELNNSIEILDSLPQISKQFIEFQNKSNGNCVIKGNGFKKQIALTFDDGPSLVSKKIIEILEKYNAKATFFWVGENLEMNENIITMAKNRGHLISNHSWNHQNGLQLSNQELWTSQVHKCLKELSFNDIENVKYYRPPYGAITQNQIDYLASKNIKTILWSITTMDWDPNQNQEGEIFKKFKKYFHNNAIVLLHDYDFGNVAAKYEDLEKVLQYGKSLGYDFVTVDQIIQ
jgi:beta-galactosidase